MTGPKMIIDQVVAAERVVAKAVDDMNRVAQQLQAQSAASTIAMQAPAGRITATNYEAHSGAGRALSETLLKLQHDLTATRQVLMSGSDEATQMANRVEVNLAGAGGGGGGGGGGAADGAAGGGSGGYLASQM